MPDEPSFCPECGAPWPAGTTCQDYFSQLLALEWQHSLPDVHHLLVLAYHLQHPGLYSPAGLEYSLGLLVGFLEVGLSPQAVRRLERGALDSGKRRFTITARPGARGAYPRPVPWTMTAADVVAAGVDVYYEQVRAWARSILASLRGAGVLSPATGGEAS